MKHRRLTSRGFTIVELMIATSIFSTILLLCTYGLLHMGRLYYKGVTMSRTQEAARGVMDELSQAIQFSGGAVDPGSGGDSGRICVGPRRFSYIKFKQLKSEGSLQSDQTRHAVVADIIDNCVGSGSQDLSADPSEGSRELLGGDMRLADLAVQPLGGGLYELKVKLVFGASDLLDNPDTADAQCKTGPGSQFCAVSELRTTVKKRVD